MEKNVLQTALDIKKSIFKDYKIKGFNTTGNIVQNILYSYNNGIEEVVLCSFNEDLYVNGISVADLFGCNKKSEYYDFFHLLLGHSFYKNIVNSLIKNEFIYKNNINLYFTHNRLNTGKIVYKIKISERILS